MKNLHHRLAGLCCVISASVLPWIGHDTSAPLFLVVGLWLLTIVPNQPSQKP